MNASAPVYKRLWVPFTIGAVLVAAAIGVGVWALMRGPVRTSPGSPVKPPAGSLPQARWRIAVYPAGALGKVPKHVKHEIAAARPHLARVVTDTFNALLLVPDRYRQEVSAYFDKPAAAALLRARLAPPAGAQAVQIRRARARIGVDAADPSRAAAAVDIIARAKRSGHRIAWHTHTVLWLERRHGRWSVMAFDVHQQPVRSHHGKHGGSGKHNGKHGGSG